MNFNTTSFIAGVGSVVVVLSTGFAGAYFLASPNHVNPPNRLQRLAAEDHTALITAKPEVVATATPAAPPPGSPAVTPAPAAATVAAAAAPLTPATPTPAQPAVQAATAAPAPAPAADVRAPEPVRTASVPETTAPVADKTADKNSTQKPGADGDNQRPSEARFVERKRSDSRRIAEQQRKQRELDVATVAVRRIIHDRDAPDVIVRDRGPTDMVENDAPEAPASPMPHFNLFGQ